MKCITKLKKDLKAGIRTLEKHSPVFTSNYYTIKMGEATMKIPTRYGCWGWLDNEATIITNENKVKIDLMELGIYRFIELLISRELDRKKEEEINEKNRKKLGQLKKLGVC